MTKIQNLTQDQIDTIPHFRDKWIDIGLDTSPLDYEASIEAANLAYSCAEMEKPSFFLFPKGPVEAMKFLAIANKVNLSEADFRKLSAKGPYELTVAIRKVLEQEESKGKISYQTSWPDFYGQHEAGWYSFYDFFAEHFGLAEVSKGLRELCKHSGWVWLFADLVMICEKPIRVTRNAAGQLHNEKKAAIEYNDGTRVYAFNGVVLPEKWVLEKETMDPSEIFECSDVDKRAAGIALYGYPRLKSRLNYKIIDGDPSTDIGALVEIKIPGLSRRGNFLEAVCPRNGTVFLGIPEVNPFDGNRPIRTAIGAQAFLAGFPESVYQHPLLRT
jgi:hypothetical protein